MEPSADRPAGDPEPGPDPDRVGAPSQRLAPLRAAAGLVAVEGLLSVMFGAVDAFGSHRGDRIAGLTGALFFVLYGAGLLACAWGMRTLRPWSRSPAVLAQLILLGLAWNVRHSAAPLAVGLAVVAVLALAGIFHPRSVDALNREQHRRV